MIRRLTVPLLQRSASSGLTPAGFAFVLVITCLSVAHHVDHILRDVTGWPLAAGLNPFSASLLVYPAIGLGVILSAAGRVGPRFWAVLAGGGAAFILVVHVGPAAGDSIEDIPSQYSSSIADVVALVVLAVFFAALAAHCVYEWRRVGRVSTGARVGQARSGRQESPASLRPRSGR